MSVLITGGVKSGKSSYALRIAEKWQGIKYFLATAVAFDDEMTSKILRHREERDPGFVTIEEPVFIDRHVQGPMILDCVTLWMNNIFFKEMEDRWEQILGCFLKRMHQDTIIVSNETGLGNIPADSMTRRYNNTLGNANKMIAGVVDDAFLMVSGMPLRIK
jgi:adenosylcobinamide kinase / adenosylcobinamide-phosphate guanylyltransferase